MSLSLIFLNVSLIAAFISLLVAGYHVLLGVAALGCRDSADHPTSRDSRFIILIPAHNEVAALGKTIDSCRAQNYPAENFKIVVIADNCSDSTAAMAEECGAFCWVRTDPAHRGKGHALAWGMAKALEQRFDAVVIVDADCTLDPNGLEVLNEHVLAGHSAVQLNNVPDNADDCSVSYLLAVANKLENDFFYVPKNRLGMAVFLRGTGMMLSRELLLACPWQSTSLAEDAEYSVRVMISGRRIYFDRRAAVRSSAPTHRLQLSTQRKRWVGGQLHVAVASLGLLLRGAIHNRDLRLVDAAWTSFILLRIVVLSILTGAVSFTLICALLFEDSIFHLPLTVALFSLALFGAYAFTGVCALGVTSRRIRLLWSAIPESFRYLLLSARACLSRNPEWKRTER